MHPAIDKIANTLDEIQTKTNDIMARQAAYHTDSATIKAEFEEAKKIIEEQRKQIAEVYEFSRNYQAKGEERDLNRGFGEFVQKGLGVRPKGQPAGPVNKDEHGPYNYEGSDTYGGHLVPPEYRNQVLSPAQERYGVVSTLFPSPIPMVRDTLYMPTDVFDDAEPDTNLTPATVAENNSITVGKPTLSVVQLTAVKKAVIGVVSNELMHDAFLDVIGAWLMQKFARKAAKVKDNFVFNDATYGIMNVDGPTVQTLQSTSLHDIHFDDLIDGEDLIPSDAIDGAKWIAHRSVINVMKKIKDNDKRYIYDYRDRDFLGYPFVRANVLPTKLQDAAGLAFGLFGDLSMAYLYGENQSETWLETSHRYFEYDQTALRLTFRIAGNTNAQLGRAVTRMTTAAS